MSREAKVSNLAFWFFTCLAILLFLVPANTFLAGVIPDDTDLLTSNADLHPPTGFGATGFKVPHLLNLFYVVFAGLSLFVAGHIQFSNANLFSFLYERVKTIRAPPLSLVH